jgi:hypothetical protein
MTRQIEVLEAILIQYPEPGERYELRYRDGSGPIHQIHCTSIEGLLERARGLRDAHAVSFAPALRGEHGEVSRFRSICCAVDPYWFEDGKLGAVDALEDLPLSPSGIVDAGSFLYAIWLLRGTHDRSDGPRVRAIMRGINARLNLGSDPDLAQVLPLPGTWNREFHPTYFVHTVSFDSDVTYDLTQFVANGLSEDDDDGAGTEQRDDDSFRRPRDTDCGGIRFQTARELCEAAPQGVDWLVKPWVALGAITEVDGAVKRAGKSTFMLEMTGAALRGDPFVNPLPALNEHGRACPVVYLTEQTASTFRPMLERAGLAERDDLYVLCWPDARGADWPAIVEAAVSLAHARGAGMIVVDTFLQFTSLSGDAENHAGSALDVVKPLQLAVADGRLAVVVIRHDRKSGGEVGDSARGSSAISGAMDTVMDIQRPRGGDQSVRIIHALSRFVETPDSLAIKLTPDGYEIVGDGNAYAADQARQALLDAAPNSEEGALTLDEFVAASGIKRTTAQKVLEELCDEHLLCMRGKGTKGDPKRYWKCQKSG